jgi:hypothetical protein
LCGGIYSVEGFAVADAIVMRALVPRAHILAVRGVLLLDAALPELLSPVRFVAAWTELFLPSLFFWPVVPT